MFPHLHDARSVLDGPKSLEGLHLRRQPALGGQRSADGHGHGAQRAGQRRVGAAHDHAGRRLLCTLGEGGVSKDRVSSIRLL